MKLKRRDAENGLESTIAALRNALDYLHEQGQRERDEKILIHRPRAGRRRPTRPVRRRDEGEPRKASEA